MSSTLGSRLGSNSDDADHGVTPNPCYGLEAEELPRQRIVGTFPSHSEVNNLAGHIRLRRRVTSFLLTFNGAHERQDVGTH